MSRQIIRGYTLQELPGDGFVCGSGHSAGMLREAGPLSGCA